MGALQCHHHGVQREACWVLGSVAGMPGRGGVGALKAVGALPVRACLRVRFACP